MPPIPGRRSIVALSAAAVVVAAAGGCATVPPPSPVALLHDADFAPPAQPVDRGAVFALNDAMRAYIETLRAQARRRDPRRVLIDALYGERELRLAYDAGPTRNAAQAFDARAGNCLSLVIMTAALARAMGLPVGFQTVAVDEAYTRQGGLTLGAGHVNLVLERVLRRAAYIPAENDALTIDFLPQSALRGQRVRAVAERTIVAMYFNNRAAESLADGRVAEAYAWARAAVVEDPDFLAAANTLAVVYLRAHRPSHAEAALRHVLARDAGHAPALANLQRLLQRQGREAEAAAVAARLAAREPVAPFHYHDRGRQAMAAGDFAAARDFFALELLRQPEQADVHFWAAQAHWRLGDAAQTARHLALAADHSATPAGRALYAAKLDRLRALPRP